MGLLQLKRIANCLMPTKYLISYPKVFEILY
jgi:hypothetical protein